MSGTPLVVRFRGGRSATEPATWSQRYHWRDREFHGDHAASLSTGVAIPVDGLDVPDVLGAVRTMVHRFETLRTTFATGPDGPWQRVTEDGETIVAGYESPPDRVDPVAAAALAELRDRPFDLTREWPVRFAVVLSGGVPRRLVVVMSGMALDRDGVVVVAGDMDRVLSGADPGPPPAVQPIDQARTEKASAADHDRALATWRRVIGHGSLTMFDHPPLPPASPPYWETHLRSAALGPAAALLAERLTVSASAVLLTATAVVLGAHLGHDDVLLSVISSNRYAGPSQLMPGRLCTDAPLRVVLDGSGFAALARRVYQDSVEAYLSASCDPYAAWVMCDELAAEAGRPIDQGVIVDDMHRPRPVPARPDAPVAALARTRVTGMPSTSLPARSRIFVALADEPDDRVRLELAVDTRYVAVPAVESLARAIEQLVVDALTDDQAVPKSIPVVRRGPSWRRLRSGWVDRTACAALWRAAGGGALVVEPGEPYDRLVAYLSDDGRSIRDLHRAVLAAIGDRSDVATPDWYVRCESAPSDPADELAWSRRPVREQGPGR
jgi:hypothetical protein